MFVSAEATRVANAIIDELPTLGSKIQVLLVLPDVERGSVAYALSVAIHRYLHEKGRDRRAAAQTASSLSEIATKAEQLSHLLRVNRKSLRHVGQDIRRAVDTSWGAFADQLDADLMRLAAACGTIEPRGRPGRPRVDELRALMPALVGLWTQASGLAWAKTNTKELGDGGFLEYTNKGFTYVAMIVAMIDPDVPGTEIDTALLTFDVPKALAKSSRVQRGFKK